MAEETTMTRAEYEAKAREAFNLMQDVRIHGGIRSIPRLEQALGHQVNIAMAQDIERAAKRAEVSRGAFYIERGLLYGMTITRTELGYRFAYGFMTKLERKE